MQVKFPDAFVRDTKLYIPLPTDPYQNVQVPLQHWIWHEFPGSAEMFVVQAPNTFAESWEVIP